jgi:hypothetical protein
MEAGHYNLLQWRYDWVDGVEGKTIGSNGREITSYEITCR